MIVIMSLDLNVYQELPILQLFVLNDAGMVER